MKKLLIIIVLALVGLIAYSMMGPYNNLVELDENVTGKWSEVETQYQRRFDLIDNLVKTVNASADFEKSTLVEVTEARASAFKALQSTNGGKDLSAVNSSQAGKGLLAVGGMRGMMMGYAEKYPDLKSTALFQDFMAQLEGTENRISKARGDFNEEVKVYNTKVRKFPNNMIAGALGFDQRDYFGSSDGAEEGVDVGGRKFGE